ncbi:PREDICTED: uncharacterized protein LOC104611661 [Nelumbo nucifera]|uniref:Uncharacterized protein LOC104611661 n=2 Tax=Nelumbo nucifera TaxID=4432 RepID=A0A1U8BJX2_NELNU|nr:PREDICTED: uncharacterized protein LOC104611661 [Nelumbo nucifera]DAD21374.1 TPA_asm: hypothetical protein HUJ06_022837 [Nelumbo nucifera]
MGRNGSDLKWGGLNSDEEAAEVLSLCDLPRMEIKGEKHANHEIIALDETEEDFEFGSLAASLSTESEMCAADDLFFRGQILPLRLSVSSDSGLAGFRQDTRKISSFDSISESLEHSSSSSVSRSNSYTSHNLSGGSSVPASRYKPRVHSHFHTHPSPKPQIWYSSSGARSVNIGGRDRRSTVWRLFRVGVVRAPEIELQDLKRRNRNKSDNSSSSDSTRSSGNRSGDSPNEVRVEKTTRQRQRFLDGLSSCKCSVSTVEVVMSKAKSSSWELSVSEKEIIDTTLVHRQPHHKKKQAISHRRTFEWLKELLIAEVPRGGA